MLLTIALACMGWAGDAEAQSSTRPDITVRRVLDTGNYSRSVRLCKDPRDNTLYYSKLNGDVYRVDSLATGTSTLLYTTAHHGVSNMQGMAIGPDGTMYLVGNEDRANTTTRANIAKGVIDSGTGLRVWSILAQTADYPRSATAFDHRFNGIVVSPLGDYVYINSGSRTDHGEVQTAGGLYPDTREVGLTTIIVRLPTNASNLMLQNDRQWLKDNGYVYAEGIRNSFDFWFAPNGDLIATENGPDRDMSEELNWLREGYHYGFPWRIGGADNPMQYPDYDPSTDRLLDPDFTAVRNGYFYNDPNFPPPPSGVTLTEPIVNIGPDADSYRDPADGQVKDASSLGQTLMTFTAHRSPTGLLFDNDGNLSSEFQNDAFVLGWTRGDATGDTVAGPYKDASQDLLHLDLTKDAGEYQLRSTRIVGGFSNPIDSEVIGNKIYVLDYGSTGGLFEITLPSIAHAEIARATAAPTIDGVMEAEWEKAKQYAAGHIINNAGTIAGPLDFSGSFRAMWDDTNLYLFVKIVDETLVNDSTSPYDDDNCEIFFDGGNEKATSYDSNDFEWVYAWNDPGVIESNNRGAAGIEAVKVDVPGGYVVEWKIPWSTGNTTPSNNKLVGLDVHIEDDDDGGTRDGKRMWWDTQDLAWQNPSLFGTAMLMPPPGVGNPPAAPTNLAASASDSQVSLTWSAASGASSYNVKRSPSSGGPYVTIASNIIGTTYINQGLTNNTTYYYVVSALNAVGESANSNEASATPQSAQTQSAEIARTLSAPTIDGILDGVWSGSTVYNVYNMPRGTFTDADLSATWRAMWDAGNLYLFAQVTDDAKVNDSTNPWEDDSVELFLDGNNEKASSYDVNDRQYIFGWGDVTAVEAGGRNATGVGFVKLDDSATSYRVEAIVPWSALGVTVAADQRIGLDIHVNDDDDGGVREGKRAWWGTIDNAWSTPSAFGTGTLLNGSGGTTLGSIGREYWTGVSGTSVSNIPVNNTPSGSDVRTLFEGPINWSDNYGARMRGYLTPQVSGSYTFWISSDDSSELWLSPNDQPLNRNRIAYVSGWTGSREWNKYTSQKSAPVNLTAGVRYYVEALMKEGGGGDNIAVGWLKPGETGTVPSEVVPGAVLAPYDSSGPSVPTPPQWVSNTPGDSKVLLSWGGVAGVSSYNVKRSTVSGGPYTTVKTGVTSTSTTDAGLTNGVTYYYVVSAVNGAGESRNSVQSAATPREPLNATILAAAAPPSIDGTAEAAWTGATSYTMANLINGISSDADCSGTFKAMWDASNLYVLVNITDDIKFSDSTNPWDDDSVEVYIDGNNEKATSYDGNDREYVFGWGDTVVVEGAGRNITGITFAQSNPTATSWVCEISIPWSAVGTTVTGGKVIGLDVHLTEDDDGAGKDGKRMWNENNNPDRAWTNPSVFGEGTLQSSPPPAAPTGLAATAEVQQVHLNWSASSGAETYSVKRSETSGGPYTTVASGVTTTSHTDTGLTGGTTYYYVVSASNAAGESADSSEASATPLTDQITFGNAGNPWAVTSTASTRIEAENYDLGGEGFAYHDSTAGNTPAQYRIDDVDVEASTDTGGGYNIGYIDVSEWLEYTVNVQQAGLYDIHLRTARSPTGDSSIRVLFNGVDKTGTLAVPSTGGWQAWTTVSKSQVSLSAGQQVLRVEMIGDLFNLNWIEIAPSSAPDTPTGLSATAGDGQVALSWTAGANADSYNVERSTTSGGPYSTIASPTTTSYTDTGLTNGTTYYYVVSAVNIVGQSGDSAEASATPLPPAPGAPTGLAATAGDAQVALSWNAVSGADSYTVKRSTTAGGPYAAIAGPTTDSYTDTGLTNGTSYYYVVSAVNVSGESANSAEASATPLPAAPAAPTSLVATAGDGQVDLSWTASTGADSYNVKRSTTGGGAYTTIASPSGTSHSDSGLTNGTAYYYVVSAVNLGGESANSGEASATPMPAAPGAPSGLNANTGDGQVTLNWTAGTDADSYKIKRSTTSGGPYTTVASEVSTTSHTDTGLSNGTAYYYVVSSVNLSGESANSNEAAATPLPAAPAAPTDLAATAGDAQVSLSWTASSGADSYNIKRSTTSGSGYATIATEVTTTSHSDTGLTNGTTYYYVVTAVNLAGESPASNESSATPQPPAPAAPTNLAATAGDAQVSLSWTDSTGADSYNVKRSTASGGPYSTIASPTTTSYTDTGLTNGQTYYYVVSAVNLGGESGNSSEASATPLPNPPAAPTGVTAVAADSSVELSWTASTGADSYNVKRGAASGGPYTRVQSGVAGTSHTDTGLTNGNTYYYVVSAVNLGGESADSAEASATPMPPAPGAPTNLAATAGNGQVALTWAAGANAESHNIKRSTTAGGPYTTIVAGVATTSHTDTGLTNGTTYYFVVTAVNLAGESTDSSEASATPLPPAPSAPADLAAAAGDGAVTLTWTASSGATSYSVKRSTSSGSGYSTVAGDITSTSYTDTGLINGTTYYYVVTAVNLGGESANSNEAGATPLPPAPAAPTGLTATAGDGSVSLSWTASAGADSYTVKRSTTAGGPYSAVGSNLTSTSYMDSSAANGTTYYYVVSASNLGGESANSSEASATPLPPPPGMPTGLAATAGDAQVTLSWTAGSGADSYNIKRSTTAGGSYSTIATGVTATSYTNSGLTNGVTYYYVVSSVNLAGESGDSAEASATPLPAPPAAPTGLAAVAGDGQITLSWNASSGADSYNVKRSTTSGSGYSTIASPTTTSYTNTGLTNGTTYYYVVSASNLGGESADSAEASAMPVPPAPAAPTGLAATGGDGQVSLAWTASAGAESYSVKRAAVSGGPYSAVASGVSSTAYTDSGLTNGTTYYYVVAAINLGGESANSAEASATPLPPAPAAPTGLAAVAGDAEVSLSWTAAAGADSYRVKRATTAGGPYTTVATGVISSSHTDSGLTNGTTYYYVVSAVNLGGESGNSNQASGTPLPPLPGNPSDLVAVPGNGQVALSWNAASNASTYNVKRSTTSGGSYVTIATGIGATSYTNTGLTNGVTYYYVVSAVNLAGEGGNSNEASATPTMPPPAAPTGLSAAAGDGQVSLTWNPSSGASSYNVKRSTASGGPYAVVASGLTATSYTNTGLANGTTYYYVVSAVNSGGESGNSGEVSATPLPPVPPAPTGLTATAGDSQVGLVWTASSGASSYRVKRSTTSGGPYTTIASGVTATSYTDTGLVNGTTYYYVVSAVNLAGESPNSAQASATPRSSLMHVSSITVVAVDLGKGFKSGRATVTIIDGDGNPVSGATVAGSFSGTVSESVSAVTDAAGTAVLDTAGSAKGKFSVTFCVDNVTRSGLTYNAAANAETCDTN